MSKCVVRLVLESHVLTSAMITKKTIYVRTWSREHVHALPPPPVHDDQQIAQEVLPGRYFLSVWSLRWERYDRDVRTVHDENNIYTRIWYSPTFASLSSASRATVCLQLSHRALLLSPPLTVAERQSSGGGRDRRRTSWIGEFSTSRKIKKQVTYPYCFFLFIGTRLGITVYLKNCTIKYEYLILSENNSQSRYK